jgi:hypothetical protein
VKTFAHSGSLGDVVYSLPAVRALSGDEPARLLLKTGKTFEPAPGLVHPLGRVLLTEAWAAKLLPLLRRQPYLAEVGLFSNQAVDFELDEFRGLPYPLSRGNLGQYFAAAFPCVPKLWEAWLTVEPDKAYRDRLVINRTARYRGNLHYRFLKNRPALLFVGLPDEYRDFRSQFGVNCPFHEARDYLELASILAGCRAFVGNQSFAWSLAEALKVPRCLEACPYVGNAWPHGPGGFVACRQDAFEKIVSNL